MKKHLVLFLAIILTIAMCACGKTEAAKSCEELISNIGEVSLESLDAIEAAEDAFDDLSDEEKDSIKRKSKKLIESRELYDQLDLEARLADAVEKIDKIGTVTVSSGSLIKTAEDAYYDLSKDEREMIKESGEKLEALKKEYDAAMNQMYATEVIEYIDEIGEVTLEKKDAITKARQEYSDLKKEARSLVTNYNVLEKAESDLKSLEKAEKERIMKEYLPKFNVKEDKVQGVTWYQHKNIPEYINTKNYVIPYIGVKNGTPWLVIRYNYLGKDWVFFEEIKYLIDGERRTKTVSYYDVTRDNQSGSVWETYDEVLTSSADLDSYEIEFLMKIANSNETIVRYQGDEYHKDYTVTASDKQAMKDTIALYGALLK